MVDMDQKLNEQVTLTRRALKDFVAQAWTDGFRAGGGTVTPPAVMIVVLAVGFTVGFWVCYLVR